MAIIIRQIESDKGKAKQTAKMNALSVCSGKEQKNPVKIDNFLFGCDVTNTQLS